MFKPSFDITSPLRASHTAEKQRQAAVMDVDTQDQQCVEEHERLSAAPEPHDDSHINRISACLARRSTLPNRRRKLEGAESESLARIDYDSECLKHALFKAESETEKAMLAAIEKTLLLYVADENERKLQAREVYYASVQRGDLHLGLSAGRYGEDVIGHAERILAVTEKFMAGLKKHASVLPKNFYPLPETEEEFLALCPPRKGAPASSMPAEQTPEQRRAEIESEQRIESFLRAVKNNDGYEAKRLWSSMMTHAERAEVIHSDIGGALTLQQIDAILKMRTGMVYAEALCAVREVLAAQTQEPASVE